VMLCFPEPRARNSFDEVLITMAAKLAGLVLERRRAKLRQELMIGELNHRNKNLFASIAALVEVSFPRTSENANARTAFGGRLNALAQAHSLMLADRRADLGGLIRQVLAPYGRDRLIEVGGPSIRLAPDAVVTLSMAMHELATNAAKYGALSTPHGKLNVSWDIAPRPGNEPWFSLRWIESGGPVIQPPMRRGFGMNAIESMPSQAIEGKARLDFAPEGLRCPIDAPFTDGSGARG
jgi:two-component sensor histidine kinase